MRVHPWIVLSLSVMALVSASQTGFAQFGDLSGPPGPGTAGQPLYPASQYAPVYQTGYPPVPGGGDFVPPPPTAPQGAWDPIAAGQNGGPGYAPARQPWPNISPFENRFTEHTNDDGLWFLRTNNSQRKFFANVDYRLATYRRPDQTRVGADVALKDIPNVDPNARLAFLPVDTGVFFTSFTANLGAVNTVAVNEQSLKSDPNTNGFWLQWGFRDPDETGLDFSVWYTPEAHWAYSRGFNPTLQSVLLGENSADGKPLTITNGLPIYNGMDYDMLIFDSFFGLDYTSVAGGGDVNWNFTPIRQSSWYKISPTVGFQTLYIGENFAVTGADTGGSVTFTTGGLATDFTALPGATRSDLNILSEVKSYLAGPQIGLRFSIGGDNLKILGHSQVGLSLNHEKMSLYGFGVGNQFLEFNSTAPNPLYSQNFRFREEQEHTRLSPTTAHQISLEAKIFSMIPVINRIHFLEKAKFRVGYQINAAFEIQRPNRTIEYNGLPLIPAIRNDQETRWYVQSTNFGVHWDY